MLSEEKTYSEIHSELLTSSNLPSAEKSSHESQSEDFSPKLQSNVMPPLEFQDKHFSVRCPSTNNEINKTTNDTSTMTINLNAQYSHKETSPECSHCEEPSSEDMDNSDTGRS